MALSAKRIRGMSVLLNGSKYSVMICDNHHLLRELA